MHQFSKMIQLKKQYWFSFHPDTAGRNERTEQNSKTEYKP